MVLLQTQDPTLLSTSVPLPSFWLTVILLTQELHFTSSDYLHIVFVLQCFSSSGTRTFSEWVSMPRFWPMHLSSLRTLHCVPNEYVCIISDMLRSSVVHPIPLQMSISAYMLIYCIPPHSRPPLVSKWESLPSFGPINSSSLTTPELAIENLLLISDLLPIFSIRKLPSV